MGERTQRTKGKARVDLGKKKTGLGGPRMVGVKGPGEMIHSWAGAGAGGGGGAGTGGVGWALAEDAEVAGRRAFTLKPDREGVKWKR